MKTDNLITSEDGSHTLVSKQFNVTYHSKFGAIDESTVVFINAGYQYIAERQDNIRIFEMGFGTGLNPLLTLIAAENQKGHTYYTGIEAHPISLDTVSSLNYTSILGKKYGDYLKMMHGEDVNENMSEIQITKDFIFSKIIADISKTDLKGSFDVIYYDAFGPGTQPFLWEEEMLGRMYSILDEEGILVTYCAKGSFKRALKKVGFKVENLPGPKGKREITRATKE